MFTIFHVFELMGPISGVVAGAVAGQRWLGWAGLVLGGVIGLVIGHIVGRIPLAVARALLKRDLERCDVATLRSRLKSEYYISHFIIAQLLIRGEPVESFRDYVAELQDSDFPDRRRFGEQILRIWPEMTLPSPSTEAKE